MIKLLKRRRTRKQARLLRDGARKLVRIHRDRLDSRQTAEVREAANTLDAALDNADWPAIETHVRKLEALVSRVFPRPREAGIRENVEVLLVAAIVAMGVRTFFLQPFKIPTGSMQPTLYGVYPPPDKPPTPYPKGTPSILERFAGTVVFGHIYGPAGYRTRGDFIFVDKLSYHFSRPRRGHVVVFTTDHIREMPAEAQGKFYIKRLIGLAGDVLRITPPHVLVNGAVLDSRAAFQRIYSMREGYNGYVNHPPLSPQPRYLGDPTGTYQVPADQFFVLGDNSGSSSDGRYWGSVPAENLVGRAILVYWPFSRRIGPID